MLTVDVKGRRVDATAARLPPPMFAGWGARQVRGCKKAPDRRHRALETVSAPRPQQGVAGDALITRTVSQFREAKVFDLSVC